MKSVRLCSAGRSDVKFVWQFSHALVAFVSLWQVVHVVIAGTSSPVAASALSRTVWQVSHGTF